MTHLDVWVSYRQFYATDGGCDTPSLEDAPFGQTTGLCGARTGQSLTFITGLHTGRVPVEVQILQAPPPPLEPEWEDAVEVSMRLTGTDLIVQGLGDDGHTIPVPSPGTYRVRYCAAGMDAGHDQDTTVGDEPAPDRYRLQCWPAAAAPDAILRTTSQTAASWHGAVRENSALFAPTVIHAPMPVPTMATIVTDWAGDAVATIAMEPGRVPAPPSWVVLLTLMVHGPDPEPAVRGTIRTEQGLLRVWRDGDRCRAEDPDGTVLFIADGHTRWQFDPDHDAPLALPLRAFDDATPLLTRRRPESFLGDDFTHPAGPIGTTWFLGRLAWTVELAPPPRKPHPMQLVVDAETGLILQRRNDGFRTAEEWIEFVAGEPVDPELFTWSGPTRSMSDHRSDELSGHRDDDRDDDLEAQAARRQEWFARHVTAEPVRVELTLDVVVHDVDEATGAFEASLGGSGIGLLARRPRSDEPWDLRWPEVQHRWRSTNWDWALSCLDDRPTERSVAALRAQLDEG